MRIALKKLSFSLVMLLILGCLSGCSHGEKQERIANLDASKLKLYEGVSPSIEVNSDKSNVALNKKINSIIALYMGSNEAIVYGKKSKIDIDNLDVKAFSQNGRSFVPVRFVSEALGAKVAWNQKDNEVQIEKDIIKIKLNINNKIMKVNDKEILMDVAPTIKEKRTFIPLRYMANALEMNIFYQEGLIVISQLDYKLDVIGDKELLDKLFQEMKNTKALELLKGAKNWAYQLQGLDLENGIDQLIQSKYDVLVIEPVRTEKLSLDFDTKAMVKRIKDSKGSDGVSRKLVIAYINIGEAEDWRWYWKWSSNDKKSWPGYIIGGDPDGWSGDYPVAYWDKDWKNLCIYGGASSKADGYSSLLEEAIEDGFDGVYLDWVEGYSENIVMEKAKRDKVDAKGEMISFLSEIRKYSKSKKEDFLIIQQNGVELYKGFPEVFDYIDAVAQEAIWYDGSSFDDWEDPAGADMIQNRETSTTYIENLKKYMEKGKVVFNVEYADKFKKEALKRSKENGFIPYCSKRPLSKLVELEEK